MDPSRPNQGPDPTFEGIIMVSAETLALPGLSDCAQRFFNTAGDQYASYDAAGLAVQPDGA